VEARLMNAQLTIAAARAFSERWTRTRQLTSDGPELLRPTPVLQYQPEALDVRPVACGRDPCRRCNIRGDIGCAHQRPCEAQSGEIAAPGQREGRRRYDRRSMGVAG
jgi:hypothetical protein